MHAQWHQLIALRDGEPVDAAVVAHMDGCAACAERLRQLARMRDALRGLPGETPPEGLWPQIAERRELETVRLPHHGRRGVIAAAVALAFTAGLLLQLQRTPETGPPGTASEPASLAELQRQSRSLESVMRRYRGPAVTSVSMASAVSDLEDSIALIDYRLTDPDIGEERRRSLWQQRVELMQTLMTVRSAERLAESI